MVPLGHAAFAYLWYVGIAAVGRRPLPIRWGLVPLAIGSQLPDLLDKPLSFYGPLVSGRSLGHSLLTAVVLIAVIRVAANRIVESDAGAVSSQRVEMADLTPLAFAVGYLSHLLADSLEALVDGEYGELFFLLWPVLSPIDYPKDEVSPFLRLLEVYQQPLRHPQFELILLAGGLFVALEVRERASRGPTPTDT